MSTQIQWGYVLLYDERNILKDLTNHNLLTLAADLMASLEDKPTIRKTKRTRTPAAMFAA